MGRRDDAQFFEKQQLKWKIDGVCWWKQLRDTFEQLIAAKQTGKIVIKIQKKGR